MIMDEIKFCDLCEVTIVPGEDFKTDGEGRFAHTSCIDNLEDYEEEQQLEVDSD